MDQALHHRRRGGSRRAAGALKVLLTLEDGTRARDPSPGVISACLRSLAAGNTYAILERTPRTYVQAALEADGTLRVEYREGAGDRHFEAVRRADLAEVLSLFLAYAAGKDWKGAFEWRPLRPPK